ncbi:MAG: hypothetical protein DRJ63_07885 [Thermoprotei archaeon]|nr:MAG: hypothetical protein DRJ63_07885 [Thermoprotei archaeon]
MLTTRKRGIMLLYGLQMGAVLIGRSFKEGIRDYLKLAEILELKTIELDFSHPELCFDGLKPRIYLTELSDSHKKRLVRDFAQNFEVKGAHLPFASMGVYSAVSDEKVEEASRKLIKFGIECAAEIDLDFVTIHLDSKNLNSEEEKWRKLKEAAEEYLDVAKQYNIVLALENTFNNFMKIPQLIRELKNSLAKMTLDTGHAYLTLKREFHKKITQYIEDNRDIIYNMHIHDSTMKRDHLMIGRGEIDFKPIIKILKKTDKRYTLNLESEPSSPQKAIEETIESIVLLKQF